MWNVLSEQVRCSHRVHVLLSLVDFRKSVEQCENLESARSEWTGVKRGVLTVSNVRKKPGGEGRRTAAAAGSLKDTGHSVYTKILDSCRLLPDDMTKAKLLTANQSGRVMT